MEIVFPPVRNGEGESEYGHPYCLDERGNTILNPLNLYKVISAEEMLKEEELDYKDRK